MKRTIWLTAYNTQCVQIETNFVLIAFTFPQFRFSTAENEYVIKLNHRKKTRDHPDLLNMRWKGVNKTVHMIKEQEDWRLQKQYKKGPKKGHNFT